MFEPAASRPELKLYRLVEPSCEDDGRREPSPTVGRAAAYRTLGGGSIGAPVVEELEVLEKLCDIAEPSVGDISGLPVVLNW